MSYKRYMFNKIFEDVVRATGLPLSAIASLSSDEQERFAGLINDTLKPFWENPPGFWPGTFAIEQRTIHATEFYILKSAAGETEIGNIDPEECFFEEKPDPESLYGVLGQVEDRGDRIVCFDDDCPDEPYIRFQLPCPEFTRVGYDDTSTYGLGGLVYSASTGECYKSLQAANTGNAVTDTDWWEVVEFPDMAKTYVKLAASAEVMSEDNGKYKQSARAQRELTRLEDVYLPARKVGR